MNPETITAPSTQLSFAYQNKQLVRLHNKRGSNVPLSQVWINEIPAEYLKLFESRVIENINKDIRGNNGDYLITTSNWKWYQPEKEMIQITFVGSSKETKPWDITVPSFLHILGLKLYVKKTSAQQHYVKCILTLDTEELVNELTLEDYHIDKPITIRYEFIIAKEEATSDDHEQAGTGSSYASMNFLNTYVSSMQKIQKIQKIVCMVKTKLNDDEFGYGSGFLIDECHIITNDHVLSKRGKDDHGRTFYNRPNKHDPYIDPQDEVLFFYDEEHCNPIIFSLDEVIHTSQSPGNKPATSSNLDFCIVRLKNRILNINDKEKMDNLAQIAISLFQFPKQNIYDYANILHHPMKEVVVVVEKETKKVDYLPQPKQIAFRGNQVTKCSNPCELHYKSATAGGSSGGLVLNGGAEWSGLHRATCKWIEQKLNLKYRELKIELQMLLASKNSKDEIRVSKNSESEIGWTVVDPNNVLLIQEMPTIKFIEKLFKEYLGLAKIPIPSNEFTRCLPPQVEKLILRNPAKLWACKFLRRISGDFNLEDLENTLRIKSDELRAEINSKLFKTDYILLKLNHDIKNNQIIWTIGYKTCWAKFRNYFSNYAGTSLTGLLETIAEIRPDIVQSNKILDYGKNFIKKLASDFISVQDIPEQHILCNIAVTASRIFEAYKNREKNKKKLEQKEIEVEIDRSSEQSALPLTSPPQKETPKTNNPILENQSGYSFTQIGLALGAISVVAFSVFKYVRSLKH